MPQIHPTAVVMPGVEMGNDVIIGPYAVVQGNVCLKDRVEVKAQAYIEGHTTIGEGTVIWPGAVIGTKTQNLKYRGERTFVEIGKGCQIREYVTINSSCGEDSKVHIGDHCLIMAGCHVAHNCSLGDHIIMANNVLLAGHVTVESHVVFGGLSAVHQFSRIGTFAMVGGMSGVHRDVPPYTLGAGGIGAYRLGGLNLVGLKRHGFPIETRKLLSQAFRMLFRMGLSCEEALARIEKELDPIPEILHWVAFCRASKRGLVGMQGARASSRHRGCCDVDDAVEVGCSV